MNRYKKSVYDTEGKVVSLAKVKYADSMSTMEKAALG
jgi:hypothetical protein